MKPPPSFVREFFDQLGPECGLRLFDALSDTRFFIKDARGVYMHASRVMHLAHGIADPSGVVGCTDHDFIPAYLADHYTRDDRQVLAGEEIWGRVEMVMRHPGCPDWYSTSKIPLRDKRGRIVGLAGVSRDLRQAARFATPFAELAPVLDFIREQFAKPMEVAALARLAGMSARSFQRHFKKAFHITPTAYVRQFRVGKACQMLIETDDTITTIALEAGFCDHSHLVREFTRLMRLSPGAYRKRYRAA
ncbi:MAG: AraC family transcriptional regulator [Chthoniobacter sp.]|nr:AraC family transcriptional regulator [Chthoniobacter sp.]